MYTCTVAPKMVPLCVMSKILVATRLEYKILEYQKNIKIIMAGVGLEPTPPRRLLSKTSALDHSATLPVCDNKTVTGFMLI